MTSRKKPPGYKEIYQEKHKSTTPQSTLNKHYFKILALFVFKVVFDANTNKLGNLIGTKKPPSKRDICIYIAQHNKIFRKFYLIWKAKGKKKSDKHYPRSMEERKKIGLDFYHNVVTDKRKNKEIDLLYNEFKKANKGRKQFYLRITEGPNRKFRNKLIK